MDINELLGRAEELGWCVREDHDEWEFGQYSPAGEDFNFCVCTSDVNSPEDLVREIRFYANDFDAEEHAKMWIEAQGHVSGVPDIKTLVKDADDIALMLNKLASAMEDVLEGREEDDDDRAELSPSIVNVVVCVKGGMVQGAYTNANGVHVDLDVIDLDVSSYPEPGEVDEMDLNQQRIDEIESDPSWRAIY